MAWDNSPSTEGSPWRLIAKWLGVGGGGVGGHSRASRGGGTFIASRGGGIFHVLPGTFLPRCALGHKMILERLDFKIMITVAGGLLMAASLLMCFIICLSYKVTKSRKGEKTVRVANTAPPTPPTPQMGSWGSVLERGHPRPCGCTLGEVSNSGRVESVFLPLPVWGCELTSGMPSATGAALLCCHLASSG